MLPEDTIVYAMFNPAIAMHEKLGEVRLGLRKFAEVAK